MVAQPTEPTPPPPAPEPPARVARRRRTPRRLRKRAWVPLTVLVAVAAVVWGVLRTRWAADEAVRLLHTEIQKQTGLVLEFDRVGFAWRHLALRAEGITLRHPREGLLAYVDVVEVRPTFSSLFRKTAQISSITVDGGRVELHFRQGRLVNGPEVKQQGGGGSSELPFRDVTVSDVAVHVDDDRLGVLDLPSVDLDVQNGASHRLLLGVLARDGAIRGARCFNGPIQRVEARAALENFRTLRVALAAVEIAGAAVHVRHADVPLDLRGPIEADASVAGSLASLLCPVPNAPALHGDVAVDLRGTVDPRALRFDLQGRVQGQKLMLDVHGHDRTHIYGLGDEVDLAFRANHDEVRVSSLRARHSEATVTSPGTHPERPIVMRLNWTETHNPDGTVTRLPRPTLAGHIDIRGFQLPELLRQIDVTGFGRTTLTVDAGAEMHGELWRFAEPPDPRHPGVWWDLDAQVRDFAVLKGFHNFQPYEPMIAVPRGSITGQLTLDPLHFRFRRLAGAFGPGNRSRIELGMIQIRLSHDARYPDLVFEGGRANRIYLEDIGHIAGMPISGEATATVDGQGPFSDPVLLGEAHLKNFKFNGLPLGDIDTHPGRPWRYQLVRIDLPLLDARAGRSTFALRDAYLDFRKWGMRAGARASTDNFYLADYFHMFKFEGDPVFAPFDGQTMGPCAPPRAHTQETAAPQIACLGAADGARTSGGSTATVAANAGGTGRTGHVDADVSFVLGRPGDDPNGVLTADITARDLLVRYANEARTNTEVLTHVGARVHYEWLHRLRGFRGARTQVEAVRARIAGGTVEASGTVDLGGAMHFVGHARGVALGRTDLLRGTGVSGTADGTGVFEGTPDAQRWTADVDVRELRAAARNLGDVSLHLRAAPDGQPARDPRARPPVNRIHVQAVALGGAARVAGALAVPWRGKSWTDVDGVAHPDWDRDWSHAEATGSVELTRALDVLPFLPTRMAARLGTGAHAQVRARAEVTHLILGDFRDADARVVIDQLDLGGRGMRFALAPGAVLAGCVNNGVYWLDPAAATTESVCGIVPPWFARRIVQGLSVASLPAARFVGPEGTQFGVAGGGTLAGRLGVSLRGEVDLARLAGVAPGVNWARGTAGFQVNVSGDTANPQLDGTLRLEGGAASVAMLPNPVDDINLLVRLDGTQIALERARARFGPSSIDLSGGVAHLAGREIDRLDVPIVVRNLALAPQAGVDVALDAEAQLSWLPGANELPVVRGDVTLTRVRYTRPVSMSLDLSGNTSVGGGGGDSEEAPYDPRNDRVRLDLRVHSRQPMRVANNLGEGEIIIAESERPFRVLGTDQRVGVLGTLVGRGRVMIRGNNFEVRRGRIEFDNPERIQPNFDVSAQAEIRRGNDASRNQWRIDMHAYGTSDRFALDMSSEPALSREDIALLLVFRMTRAELDQIGGASLVQSAAAEALVTATGLDRTVRQAIPVIDDFRIGTAYSPGQGRTVPQVAVGRRVNDRVRVDAMVNTSEQREMRATMDVRMGRQTSVQLGYDNINDQGSTQVGNLGADLRWRLEFE